MFNYFIEKFILKQLITATSFKKLVKKIKNKFLILKLIINK